MASGDRTGAFGKGGVTRNRDAASGDNTGAVCTAGLTGISTRTECRLAQVTGSDEQIFGAVDLVEQQRGNPYRAATRTGRTARRRAFEAGAA